MGQSEPLRIIDTVGRAKNALALLHHLLGSDFPKGVEGMSRYRRLLAYARAAKRRAKKRKKTTWEKVRFVLVVAEMEAWDATSFAFFRGTPEEEVLNQLEKLLALYGDLEAKLKTFYLGLMDPLFRFEEQGKTGIVSRLRRLAEVAMNEEVHVRSRRVDFLLCGQGAPAARAMVGVGTRVGMTPRESSFQRQRLEARMRELRFSQSEIGMLVDGPGKSAKETGRKYAQRQAAAKRRKSAPRKPGGRQSGTKKGSKTG